MKTCFLLGKGPSLADAERELSTGRSGVDVCSLNEAGRGVARFRDVEHLVCVDVESLDRTHGFWPRVGTFHLPSKLHRETIPDPRIRPASIEGLPQDRVEVWPYRDVLGVEDVYGMRKRLAAGRLCFTCTAAAALHLMARRYQAIHCFGIDGDGNYAHGHDNVHGRKTAEMYALRRLGCELLAEELGRHYGCEITFAPRPSENSRES